MHSYSHTIVHLVTLPRVTFLDFIVWFFALDIATMSKVSFQIWKVKIQVLLIFQPLSIWCCYSWQALVHWLWLFYLFRRWENWAKYGLRALKIQQKFHVLFVGRMVAGEIPVFWLIPLTETSFSSAKNVMYTCSSALKARVKTVHGKWNSQTFTTGYLNQERHTSWFSCRQLLCCHLFSINYLLFCEMYEIYRECARVKCSKSTFQVKYNPGQNYLRKCFH